MIDVMFPSVMILEGGNIIPILSSTLKYLRDRNSLIDINTIGP